MAAPLRPGNKSFENVVRTDERYGHEGFWLGPRGRDYGSWLEHPKPCQIANLYPDSNASYWIAQYDLPVGARLTLRGRFPYCRYMSFALYHPDPLGAFTATSEAIVDHEITPEPGWTYRTRTLTEDLKLDVSPAQASYAVGDEFHQYYTRI